MAIQERSNQLRYVGKGPLDAKALVKTYADLFKTSTWTVQDDSGAETFVAYNGMMVAVWLNKDDTSKNGIYFLHDPAVTSALKKPNVVDESNWHKLLELSEVPDLANRLSTIETELTGVKTRLATLETDRAIIRRDNEYNYKQKTPANNEICLVDVAGYGLRVKIGDGKSAFADLPYIDEAVLSSIDNVIIKGYLYQDNFYADAEHTILLQPRAGRIYIEAASSKLYTYTGTKYELQRATLPNATAEIAGAVKLYDQTGQNTDGTMTQRAITKELGEKFEMDVVEEEEMIVFDTDIN